MNYFLLIQTIISAIKAVETLMPASPGKDKFDAAILMVESVVGSVQDKMPAIQGVIAMLVSAFNASGLFKKAV